MEIPLKTIDGSSKKKVRLPAQFDEQINLPVIKRAVLAIESHDRQRYGAKIGAGMRASATLSRRRKDYRGAYGHGISRVPRKIMSRRGTRMNWVGAVAPGMVGGRRAHPPKAEKIWDEKINKKERRLAIRAALSAAMQPEYVKERGHQVPNDYPFAVESKIEDVQKTAELLKIMSALGFKDELARTNEKKIRAGKGKMRGRKYIRKVGLLVVVSTKDCKLAKYGNNLPGVDVIVAEKLNAKVLAPGLKPGRMIVMTDSAIKVLEDKKLFY